MLLHRALASLDLRLLATIVASAVEREHWTWMSGHGNRHRIYYVAVPAELAQAVLAVQVYPPELLAIGSRIDHRAAAVHLRLHWPQLTGISARRLW